MLRPEGVWHYHHSVGTVKFVVANAGEAKLGLSVVGADLPLLDLFGVIVEIENDGACLTGCCASGCYLLPLIDHSLVKMELWF